MSQTSKCFHLFIFNDSVTSFCDTLNSKYDKNFSFSIVDAKGSPTKIREYAINYIYNLGYENVMFADADDYFASNRVSITSDLLKDYDGVVNDLSLFNCGSVYKRNLISKHFNNRTLIKENDLLDKNFIGMSNSAVKTKMIYELLPFPDNIVALDWYLFSIIIDKGARIIFTNDTHTFYRQHDNNQVGFKSINNKLIKQTIKVKAQHYGLMLKFNKCKYTQRFSKYSILSKDNFSSGETYKEKSLSKDDFTNHLWWESI